MLPQHCLRAWLRLKGDNTSNGLEAWGNTRGNCLIQSSTNGMYLPIDQRIGQQRRASFRLSARKRKRVIEEHWPYPPCAEDSPYLHCAFAVVLQPSKLHLRSKSPSHFMAELPVHIDMVSQYRVSTIHVVTINARMARRHKTLLKQLAIQCHCVT